MITSSSVDDLCSWIAALPSSVPFPIVSSSCGRSIFLSFDQDAATASITFSISFNGSYAADRTKTLWVSDPVPSSTPNPYLLLLLQLLHEAIIVAPSLPHSRLSLSKSDSARILHTLNSSPDTPALLFLALLSRLFWLCAGESPADVGFLFFSALDAALDAALNCRCSLRAFLLAVGADREEQFMLSVGYMIAKWGILREMSSGPEIRRFPAGHGLSYAAEVHGLWIMKGYTHIPAMSRSCGGWSRTVVGAPNIDPKEAALRYALAHQQLKFVVQLEYTICGRDPRFLKISVRVDNIRLHVARLVFKKDEREDDEDIKRPFPSRLKVWIGPEADAGYAVGPSLGRSTENPERVVETIRTLKGGFGFPKGGPGAGVRAKVRQSTQVRRRSWRWEQEAEGNVAIFDGVLCDTETGAEVSGRDMTAGMRRRYNGAGRVLSKGGGLVIAGDELPEVVAWRVGREMEGQSVRWRMGGRVWMSYFPNEAKSGYYETRWVEWEEEVEFTLLAGAGGCC